MDSLAGDCINLGALENRFGAIRLPGRAQVGWAVSEVQAAFVTTLATVYGSRCDPSNPRIEASAGV